MSKVSGVINIATMSSISNDRTEKKGGKFSGLKRFFSFLNCAAAPKSFSAKFQGNERDSDSVLITHIRFRDNSSSHMEESTGINCGDFEQASEMDCINYMDKMFSPWPHSALYKKMEPIYMACKDAPEQRDYLSVKKEITQEYQRSVNKTLIKQFAKKDIEVMNVIPTEMRAKIDNAIQSCREDNKSLMQTLEAVVRLLPGKEVRILQVAGNKLKMWIGDWRGRNETPHDAMKRMRKLNKRCAVVAKYNQEKVVDSESYRKKAIIKVHLDQMLTRQVEIAKKNHQLQHLQQIKKELQESNYAEPAEWSATLINVYDAAIAEGQEELSLIHNAYEHSVSNLINQ